MPDPLTSRHVAIIGAGFSGTLQAINILRHDGPRVTLIERQPHAGRGVAYSSAHPRHLLNVRAGNMSALPDDPGHFARWVERVHPELGAFVPRIIYGDYLSQLLAEARRKGGDQLTLVTGDVVSLRFAADGARLTLADGSAIAADSVVLAPGNLPPHVPPALQAAKLDADRYVGDPWHDDVAAGLDEDDVVLIVGTGLTMVDVALLLEARGFRGKIVAMSRRGLIPHSHADTTPGRLSERPTLIPSDLVHDIRQHAEEEGWRSTVDALRPYTQSMWLAAERASRAGFLRHLRPYWDIHRHRLAPDVAARVSAMRERGQLSVLAGKIVDAAPLGDGLRLSWRPRGQSEAKAMDVRRAINCSGPQGDLLRSTEPLLRQLLADGTIRPDAQRLGIDVNPQAEAIDADGRANPNLLVVGPMTRGTFWEIVAVPDIRLQTWEVARRLSHAHWVEAEGL